MKLRVLKKDIYISSDAQNWRKAKSISRTEKILQMWDDKEGWINIPEVVEGIDIFNTGMSIRSY